MNSVRLRRLQADYEAVRRLVHLHPRIEIGGVSGNPPERYRLLLAVRSLRQNGGELSFANRHELEIKLPLGYPRDAPVCRMLTPVFHPNIAPHAVCIGDHWTAAESLDRLIMRVCEMLAFQSYNTKSPLNGEAAQWVETHLGRLPIDHDELFLDLEAAPPVTPVDQQQSCRNCDATSEAMEECAAGHRLCGDCVMFCEQCHAVLCLVCGTLRCERCVPDLTVSG